MSFLNDLKYDYNYYLNRYYKGCKYCSEHIEEVDKWILELLDIMDNINLLGEEICKYIKMTEEEVLYGFKV